MVILAGNVRVVHQGAHLGPNMFERLGIELFRGEAEIVLQVHAVGIVVPDRDTTNLVGARLVQYQTDAVQKHKNLVADWKRVDGLVGKDSAVVKSCR